MSGGLHLVKLCVGAPSVESMAEFVAQRSKGGARPVPHVTRMRPTRTAELLEGGSLYWVIDGAIRARQALTAIDEVVGEDGVRRAALMLAPRLVATAAWPRRPFQGWRYLAGADAPPDLDAGGAVAADQPTDAPSAAVLAAMAAFGVA